MCDHQKTLSNEYIVDVENESNIGTIKDETGKDPAE
jgi:hypothetical protein